MSLSSPTALKQMEPAGLLTPTVTAAFERLMTGHPLIAHYARTADGHARKVSDFVSQRQLHRLAFYNEYVRPFFGLEYQRALDGLGLTSRETEVLHWVTVGKTNAEIGTILGSRSRTVEKHLERIYRKLGVENRTAAASIARDHLSVRRTD